MKGCGEKTNNPFAAQTVTGLILGKTYVLTFDYARYPGAVVRRGGTGRSLGVFVDLSGAPAFAVDDKATMQPLFLSERGGTEFVTSTPIAFVATGTTATIYFEAELDERTPGGPSKSTDVAYLIDNIDLRVQLQ